LKKSSGIKGLHEKYSILLPRACSNHTLQSLIAFQAKQLMSRHFRSAREHAQEHAVLADEMVMARGSHMQRHDPRNGNAAARCNANNRSDSARLAEERGGSSNSPNTGMGAG
jgi:hypothetical protein